ncbi:MAG TPA: 30S ribosomal protein S20 [Gammaproteobacteria bacterium]|nr:30S ribosomal protein S20 [Gammaproteobacteria bacterium]
MANTPQARKRARQNNSRRLRNRSQRSALRTQIKTFTAQIEAGDTDTAKTTYLRATSIIDHSARKGLLHRNKAARLKSRMNARLRVAAA